MPVRPKMRREGGGAPEADAGILSDIEDNDRLDGCAAALAATP